MDLKYCNSLTDDTAEMRIYAPIGVSGISGNRFADELEFLSGNVRNINVRINSPGGSVLEGYSIFAAIQRSKATVDTYIDGIAASIAGIISQAGHTRHMVNFGRLMVHNPSIDGKPNKKDQVALESIKESLVTIFGNHTNADSAMLSTMLDEETWINPADAKKWGFVDEIYTSKRKPKTTPEIKDAYKLYTFYNSILIPKNMDKICNTLGLQNEASEESVVAAIEILKKDKEAVSAISNKVEELEKENEDLKAKVEDAEKKVAEEKTAKAVELVENAIKAGKIKADSKDSTIEFAKSNYASAKAMIEGLNTGHANIMNVLNPVPEPKDERADWTHRDWEIKDAAGLEKLYQTEPEKASTLYNQTYKK